MVYKGLENQDLEIEVELIFDNKSCGLPVDQDLVSVKRVWTVDGKDDLYLNGKGLTKNDADNLFECCGLPRDTAHNIVKQVKIHEMIQMDEERLFAMLKDVTGSKQYELKKQMAEKQLIEVTK